MARRERLGRIRLYSRASDVGDLSILFKKVYPEVWEFGRRSENIIGGAYCSSRIENNFTSLRYRT